LNALVSFREHADRQKLLFDISPLAHRFGHASGSSAATALVERGFTVCRSVRYVEDAFTIATSAIAELGKREPYRSLDFSSFRVAKADRIPVCESIKITRFQCLHFDYGLPVLDFGEQPLYGVVALYKRPCSERSPSQTRIVRLNALKKVTSALRHGEIGRRLREYVAAYGDGWRQPEPANTGRISIFLRFVEAIFGQKRFASLIESDSANFLIDAAQQIGLQTSGVEAEELLLQDLGIDLGSVEERVCLEPGDMLLLDNLAVVHGRIGRRQPRELWQMLFGLASLSPTAIERVVSTVCTTVSALTNQ